MSTAADSHSQTVESLRSKIYDTGTSLLLGSSLLYGIELGLFRALSNRKLTCQQLCQQLSLDHRYTQEWLLHMCSNSIIAYDMFCEPYTYWLNEVQKQVLHDETSKFYTMGLIEFGVGCNIIHPKLLERWQLGTESANTPSNCNSNTVSACVNTSGNNGILWNELDKRITDGLRRWFGVNYRHLLTQYWLPSISDDILQYINTTTSNSNVADIGCGHGLATIQLAKYFNKSTVYGFDLDPQSLNIAKEFATKSQLNNVIFDTYDAQSFKSAVGKKFDLVFFFAAFHDMSNPQDIIKHVKSQLNDNGAVILVEPYAGDTIHESIKHPGVQLFSGVSLHYCTCCAKAYTSDKDALVMGAVSTNDIYHKLWVEYGGFSRLRLLSPQNTPNNRLFEIRL